MNKVGSIEVLAYFGDAKHDFPNLDKSYKFGFNMYIVFKKPHPTLPRG